MLVPLRVEYPWEKMSFKILLNLLSCNFILTHQSTQSPRNVSSFFKFPPPPLIFKSVKIYECNLEWMNTFEKHYSCLSKIISFDYRKKNFDILAIERPLTFGHFFYLLNFFKLSTLIFFLYTFHLFNIFSIISFDKSLSSTKGNINAILIFGILLLEVLWIKMV